MSQIKQLIRLYQGGSGIKTIARILGMSKNTVRSYLKKMAEGGFNTEELLRQEDPLLERSFHAGNPAYKADKFEYLKSRLDYYEKELARTGVTKLLLWQEYIESDPTGYSYPQFCGTAFFSTSVKLLLSLSYLNKNNAAEIFGRTVQCARSTSMHVGLRTILGTIAGYGIQTRT